MIIETKVNNAIPALKYELDKSLQNKASVRDIELLSTEKASMKVVDEVVKRINKLEEQISSGATLTRSNSERRRGRGRSVSKKSEAGDSDMGDLSEVNEDDEDDYSEGGRTKDKFNETSKSDKN